ncbi:hypothetical protein HBI56_133950 [Parastagonospora nodorum]|nr:hypothetical protein HBH53_047700 [Parastagonospora nodorum]KAH4039633.1 hypothetical protein HBI09_034450 [Parastagonospora nodorum]KAH4255753.1 hypothetical protein HBI03_172740 [Parastagonospora nodorum]KAH4280804.1 hypothetical protein HBI04_048540 [Parastagonospora nodorum]KAH4815805.1 hypothetical protein HBH61_059330 [Parastagonospora nodorum]
MGSIADLPRGDSPTLRLVHPTDEEKLMQFNLNGAEWRGALSLPAYLRREETLSQQALTRDGGISYWILIDTALEGNPLDPLSGTRLPLASCETYRKKTLIWQNGELHESICHGIGSVFCASHLRKRGYAQRMMTELSQALRTYQMEEGKECMFSVLFSDIGKKFYNTFGWEPFNSSHIAIPGHRSATGDSLPTARPLYAEDLEELCDTDVTSIKQSLKSRPQGSKPAIALLPDIDTIRWHHAREEFVGTELHRKAPKVKGAIVGTEKGKRVWCYWTRMWYNNNPAEAKGNTLHILRLVIEDGSWADTAASHGNGASKDHSYEASIAALMALAQQEAETWKMEHVEIWNPAEETVKAAQRLYPSAEVVDRDEESIASLQWYPKHDGPIAEKLDWIANEKYGWC